MTTVSLSMKHYDALRDVVRAARALVETDGLEVGLAETYAVDDLVAALDHEALEEDG